MNSMTLAETAAQTELENLQRLAKNNQDLFDSGVITKREYNRNTRLIGNRAVALLSADIEEAK